MNITGIIAEYNPFHNGHKYQIAKAAELTKPDFIIVIMSGNFVQRGEPSILPKHLRAKAALTYGADLVIELPVYYSTGSAEFFATGAIALLDALGASNICFGSECSDIKKLSYIADILAEEPLSFRLNLNQHLKEGLSFPKARQTALKELLPSEIDHTLLDAPNNILGIEYLKAIKKIRSSLKPFTVQRNGSEYRDTCVNPHSCFASATAIRNILNDSNTVLPACNHYVPADVSRMLFKAHGKCMPVTADDFSLLLKQKILSETAASLTSYLDVSDSLANKIIKRQNNFISYSQYCALLKSNDITYARISRALLHILLGLTQNDLQCFSKEAPYYARTLGFRTKSTELMKYIKRNSSVPLISKLTKTEGLSTNAQLMLKKDIYASNLYESVITEKFGTPFINEYKKETIRF